MMLHETMACLDSGAGYAPLDRVRKAILDADLGGSFLTEHFLLDVLRRHGRFEILPGPILAAPTLGLARWIQRSAREVLRSHCDGLTPQQLIAQRPDLAEFDCCLSELLELDPLVQSEDGLHYKVV